MLTRRSIFAHGNSLQDTIEQGGLHGTGRFRSLHDYDFATADASARIVNVLIFITTNDSKGFHSW